LQGRILAADGADRVTAGRYLLVVSDATGPAALMEIKRALHSTVISSRAGLLAGGTRDG
jgi:hypothetical protein